MKYIVIELQKNDQGQVANIVTSFDSENDALSKFHTILGFAAVSELPVHSAVVLNEEGYTIRNESYRHEVENDG